MLTNLKWIYLDCVAVKSLERGSMFATWAVFNSMSVCISFFRGEE